MRSFLGRDILSLKDMEREEYFQIFSVADRLKPFAAERRNGDLLKHKTLLTAFYQPSTRTRLATEAAMHRLGGHVLGFSDAKMTRAGDFYQETIKDTVHMLEYYGDVIAMRHFQQGAPAEAAKWASVPVINCGDGWGEHPTQVLTDLYTIWQQKGPSRRSEGALRRRHADADDALDPLRDARSSTSRPSSSGRRTCRCSTSSRPSWTSVNVQYSEKESVESCIADADVIYMEPVVQADYTVSRDEATEDKGLTPAAYRVTRELLTDEGQERRHHPALAAPDGRAAARRRQHPPRPLLGRGLQRRRHADGAARARPRRDRVGDRRCRHIFAAGT